MTTEATHVGRSNQGFTHRWTIDAGDTLTVDLRNVESIEWGEQSLIAEVSTDASGSTKVQYTLDTDDDTFADATPPTDWWRDNTGSPVAGGATNTIDFDAAITGCRFQPTGAGCTVTLLSPVDLAGAIAQAE